METREAIVIGAGPAGLATAAMLKKRGIDVLVLERDEAVGSSWRKHYDRLHLHTVRWLSHLPGYRLSRRHGKWVSRDGVIGYEVDSEQGRDVRRELARAVVSSGWGLLELRPMRMSLEEVFLSLTTEDVQAVAAAEPVPEGATGP